MNDKAKLFAKMAKVMGELSRLPKSGHNNFFGYDFVTDADISDALRQRLADNGLAFFASMVDYTQTETINEKGKQAVRTAATFEFTFACTETGESMTCRWFSEAIDNADKGLNKAATAALKYFLMKTFIISSGDVQDDTDSGDQTGSTPGKKPSSAPRDVMTDKTTAAQFWSHWSGNGMTSADIMTALGVERLSDFAGSRADADAAMKKYIEANTTNVIGKKAEAA